jgi:hypothetical protein
LAGANIRPFPETRNPFEGFFINNKLKISRTFFTKHVLF